MVSELTRPKPSSMKTRGWSLVGVVVTDYLGPKKTRKEWAVAVDTAYDLLRGVARSGQTITYSKANQAVDAATGMEVPRGQFARFLEHVTLRSEASDDVVLSSLVVSEDTGEPGAGFLDLVGRLRRADPSVESPAAIVRRLQKECWAAFAP